LKLILFDSKTSMDPLCLCGNFGLYRLGGWCLCV
jgi:hypothetical protein